MTAVSQPVSSPEPPESSSPSAAPSVQQQAPSVGKKTKVAYYQDSEQAARIRGAFQATAHLEGHRSFSDFHATVLEQELNRLEAKYNDGKPFQGAPPKSGRLGRPLD